MPAAWSCSSGGIYGDALAGTVWQRRRIAPLPACCGQQQQLGAHAVHISPGLQRGAASARAQLQQAAGPPTGDGVVVLSQRHRHLQVVRGALRGVQVRQHLQLAGNLQGRGGRAGASAAAAGGGGASSCWLQPRQGSDRHRRLASCKLGHANIREARSPTTTTTQATHACSLMTHSSLDGGSTCGICWGSQVWGVTLPHAQQLHTTTCAQQQHHGTPASPASPAPAGRRSSA